MLNRIVRMVFSEASKPVFIETFYKKKPLIESFQGCQSVKLMQDESDKNVLYTYSLWDKNENLQKYRNSAMFAETWRFVKPLFTEKAQAFSLLNHITDETT